MRHLLFSALLVSAACQNGDGDGTDADPDPETTGATGTTPTSCEYPEGAVEPMALGEVLTPYAWPDARHLDGVRTASLDLIHAPCNTDDDIDWSPHDVLVFVSIPAW